ncbi:Gfo/Idh/MocA family protein [Paenibacillus ginsengarvi]|uniref:Gfo/Idh/MocA family oxidoreductase n=1 Tax=Paenibacillus ginsengarvi TaxID=400777 RepID=A0A3B0CTE0_9BACL|nr:Gfo/Idh/MocA family oxidoreductase [Paenibacillus ginsengarvi]RKN86704.1 gfo/Idh/MocA family oxidoreductase [Paenibacillus ginsengarvi]
MTKSKLRWGIIGCAGIAVRSVIPGIAQSERGEVTAIASRDETKAKETAEKLGIPKAYGSYEALLADGDIDAVYIPLPNNMHKEWTIRAAEAGKHVLCEKPFSMDAAEAAEMVEACAKHGVKLAEAFMYRHHPRYKRIKEIIASGEIGTIRGIHGTFTFNNSANTTNFRNNQAMGGGALYDIGVYPISAARLLLDAEPEAATVHAFFSPEHGGVDMMASGLLEFGGGVALTFDCAMWAAGRNTLEVLGTEGRIELPSAFVSAPNAPSVFYVTVKGNRREETIDPLNQYSLQADDFAATVLDGAPSLFGEDDPTLGMRVLDACLESARTRSRIVIS